MELVIERSALLNALAHVQSVVERRTTIPILSNVLLEAENDRLQFSATDLDMTIEETVTATVKTPGSLTTPAHVFYDIVRKLPDGAQVSLKTEVGDNGSERLVLQSGRAQFLLLTLAKDDFPAPAQEDFSHEFSLTADSLLALLEKTRYAMSNEETRYYLNGVYVHSDDESQTMQAVATDGHRLIHTKIPLPNGAKGMPGIIIPRKTVHEIYKLLDGKGEEAVTVSLSDSKIRFQFADMVLLSKLVDGNFPEYDRVIPQNNQNKMVVGRQVFASVVDRVATLVQEKGRGLKLGLKGGDLSLSLSVDQGSANEDLNVIHEGNDMETGFNARYLLDVCQQTDGDDLTFLFGEGTQPCLVKDDKHPDTLFVLMPMRV